MFDRVLVCHAAMLGTPSVHVKRYVHGLPCAIFA
jgi:hypothetical protein